MYIFFFISSSLHPEIEVQAKAAFYWQTLLKNETLTLSRASRTLSGMWSWTILLEMRTWSKLVLSAQMAW